MRLIVGADTGANMASALGIRAIRWTCESGKRPYLSLDLCSYTELEITSEMRSPDLTS